MCFFRHENYTKKYANFFYMLHKAKACARMRIYNKMKPNKKMLIAFYYGWSDTLLFAISVGLSHECERIHSLYCFSPKTEIRMNGKQQEMLRKKKHTQKSTGSEQKTRQTRVWKIYVCIGLIPKQWDDRGVKFVVNEPHSSDTVSSCH